jgi:putative PIN family toxin of toxin-antitoxin system
MPPDPPESPARRRLRVVLDTNVLVSVLLYRDGELAWVAEAWTAGFVVPLADQGVIDELLRILIQLGAQKFQLQEPAVQEILSRYLSFAEPVPAGLDDKLPLPKCKDPDDQKFLELAVRGRADVLVTNDGALLGLSRRTPFLILAPGKFRRYAEESGAVV